MLILGEGMIISRWTSIDNSYMDEMRADEGIVEVYIDAWRTYNMNEEGKVIAIVKGEQKENIFLIETSVDYKDIRAQDDEDAQEKIEEAKEMIIKYFEKER